MRIGAYMTVINYMISLCFVALMYVASNPSKAKLSESRNIIAILDSGLNLENIDRKYLCDDGHQDFTGNNNPFLDEDNHGSLMYEISVDHVDASKTCFVIIKAFTVKSDYFTYLDGLEYVAKIQPLYLLLSVSVVGNTKKELSIFENIAQNTTVIAGAGNSGIDLDRNCEAFPACYGRDLENVVVVGSNISGYNYGSIIDVQADPYYNYNNVKYAGTSIANAKILNLYLPKERL